MELTEFKSFVSVNQKWFAGVHPETSLSISQYETELGYPLPSSLKWLLTTHGYSGSCGIDNLKESVHRTVECRQSIALPESVLLINDWGDAGLVFCIADGAPNSEYPFIWSDSGDIHQLIQGHGLPSKVNRYPGYPEWVQDRLRAEKEDETKGPPNQAL